ncbi:MAG: DNA polymerase III subunit [Oscillospiraceae bacterium]|nr:DNA polymerase III subunit [Oscillospiraceae bacterium]MBR2896973.1 DNA polymerase III subunit [Oscillospiraceae bacterium]MBR3849053.1 DNA polymerase III subunit [Oscillospiraceae bacterium]
MSLSTLLGNEELKKRLTADLRAGRLSHCYLLSGPEGSGKHTLARLLAAAMECTASEPPCLCCGPCRKVLDGVHPDVAEVDDDTKKTVSVELARRARTELYVRPGEGKRKVYLFPRAQDLTPQAQNALLKVLEEPPEYGAFILLSDRAEAMLPTVRSRCVELALQPVSERDALPFLRERFPEKDDAALRRALRIGEGWIGRVQKILREEEKPDPLAEELLDAYAGQDALALTQALFKLERRKREQMLPVLRQVRETLIAALAQRSGRQTEETPFASARTTAELSDACRLLSEAIHAAESNAGVGHVCGYLAVTLR